MESLFSTPLKYLNVTSGRSVFLAWQKVFQGGSIDLFAKLVSGSLEMLKMGHVNDDPKVAFTMLYQDHLVLFGLTSPFTLRQERQLACSATHRDRRDQLQSSLFFPPEADDGRLQIMVTTGDLTSRA